MKLRRPVLLFDGGCPLCRFEVKWLIERDRAERLRFATLQSTVGRRLLRAHGLRPDYRDSSVLVEGDRLRLNSDAFLRSCAYLDSRWRRLAALRAVPRPVRDTVYHLLAQERYRIRRAGRRKKQMWTPPPELRPRFIGAPYTGERVRARKRASPPRNSE